MASIGILILAAGNSSRMGRAKQLLDFGGKPLVRHTAEVALRSGCRPVIVVCGELEADIRLALKDLPVEIVSNADWAGGIGTSIQAGLRALSKHGADGAIITLADLPLLTAAIYDGLVDAHRESGKPIVTASYAGTVGVPVLFARDYFQPLLALAPNQGCKGVILAHDAEALRVPCPEAEIDVDTPEDYETAARAYAAQRN